MLPLERPQQSLLDVYADSQQGARHECPDAQGLNPAGAGVGSWRYGPRVNPWIAKNTPPAGWTHILAWLQAFHVARSTSPAPLFVRNLQLWAIGSAGWQMLDACKPYGQAFSPSYDAAGVAVAQPASTADTLSAVWPLGQAFHAWGPRRAIPAGLRGVLVTCEARTDGDIVIGLAADFYKDATTVPRPGDYSANCDVGIGRNRRVTSEWRAYGWTSASLDDITNL